MEKPVELSDAEAAAVAGGCLNNIFINTGTITNSFNTSSFNTNSNNTSNSFNPNVVNSFNPFQSLNGLGRSWRAATLGVL